MTEADLRDFMQEMLLRWDRRDRKLSAQLARQWEEADRRWVEANRKLDDLLAENKAQRDALFRVLNRLDNGGTAPA